jgi:thiamine-monophosphate kinase
VATLADVGERRAIDLVQKILGRRAREAARLDDAAVVRVPRASERDLVTTTDTLSFSTHRLKGTPARLFGYFACAVSISDLAAMGARPLGMLLALGLPRATAVGELEDLALGFRAACNKLDFDVWGGDLKEADAPYVTGTAFGVVSRGRALRRARGVKPGWKVGVTGFVGRAALGAALASRGDAVGFELVYLIEPRVPEGQAAARVSAKAACIDSSDGLAASLHHLSRANGGVGFEVDAGKLPLQPGLRKELGVEVAQAAALSWGGDYELVICSPPKAFGAVGRAMARLGTPFTEVGRAVEGGGLFLVRDGVRRPIEHLGYEHFKSVPTGTP